MSSVIQEREGRGGEGRGGRHRQGQPQKEAPYMLQQHRVGVAKQHL